MLPTKEDIIKSEWLGWYSHFNLRLKERYGLEIDFDEYKELCKRKVERIKLKSANKCVGFLEIKGRKVKVAKEIKRNRILSTALYYKEK